MTTIGNIIKYNKATKRIAHQIRDAIDKEIIEELKKENSMGIEENLDKFLEEVGIKITATPSEMQNIVVPMFVDGWNAKDTVNQIKSVRDFNAKHKIVEEK